MLIALTGATGFVGRYIARRLAQSGHKLRCWHRPESDLGGLDEVGAAIEWLPGELGDGAAVNRLIRGVDAVVHAAVQWAGPRNRQGESAEPFISVNLLGTLQLFEAAFTAQVPRFVHISTCAVHEVILGDRPLDEAHPLWPTSHYGAHKAALEKFVHSYGLGHGWNICALRPTGVYGVDRPPEKSRWFELVGQVLRGEAIDSARGGKEVHAADVAKAAELLLQAKPEDVRGQAFNCYDQYVAEQEVARIAKEISGSPSTIADRNRGPKHQISTEKIRRLGMHFGSTELLRSTINQLIDCHAQPRGA